MAKCLQNVIVNLKIKFFYGRRILSNFLRRYFIISHRVDAPQHNQSSAISAAYTIIEFRFKQRLFYNGLFAYRFFLTFVFEYLNKRTTNDCLNHRFTVALFVSYKPCWNCTYHRCFVYTLQMLLRAFNGFICDRRRVVLSVFRCSTHYDDALVDKARWPKTMLLFAAARLCLTNLAGGCWHAYTETCSLHCMQCENQYDSKHTVNE